MLSDGRKAYVAGRMLASAVFSVAIAAATAASAQEPSWPREIDVPEAKIIVYQPQIEEFRDDMLTARSAVAVTPAGKDQPVFGCVWFAAHVRTDHDTRMVSLVSLDVTDVKFPNAKQENRDKLAALLKSELPKQSHPFSLDRLLTALNAAEKEEATTTNLNPSAPKIIVSITPAVLVAIDGDPVLRPVEKSGLMRVVNTPFLILQEPKSKAFYLRGGDDWYETRKMVGPWERTGDVPAAVAALVVKEPVADQNASYAFKFDIKPQIIVATEPTELICTNGEPKYAAIKGTSLNYVTNTDNDVFVETTTGRYFVLLSGRWYVAGALTGPWSFVAADRLPPDFARIPRDSDKGDVLANVAGTPEAIDAIHETYIPQTAEIDRKKATVKVEYDGEPQFKPIEGTAMRYAVNTPDDVIQVGEQYYCCNEGVWFVADSPTGTWVACATVPQAIYTIPPSCPVYPVTYVRVYDSTPDAICVGYTGGYVGCYPYCGAVVWGTGYWYRGWCGNVYWARPATWGFNAHYNSITDSWGFRVGYAGPNGWIGFGYRNGVFHQGGWVAGGWHGGWGGWWGHGGFHDHDFDGQFNVNNVNIHNRVGNRLSVGDRQNIYGRFTNADRIHAGAVQFDHPRAANRPAAAAASGMRNDVYADRNGNVFRRTQDGWQQRVGDNWTRADFNAAERRGPQAGEPARPPSLLQQPRQSFPGQRPDARPATPAQPRPAQDYRPATPQYDLNRQFQARDRGEVRTNNYQNYSRGSGGYARPSGGGGIRGGGGGFRGGRR